MRSEILQRAMQAFATMDLDAAKRCLDMIETVAELHPSPDLSHLIDQAALQSYRMGAQMPTAPAMGAMSITRLSKLEARLDLN